MSDHIPDDDLEALFTRQRAADHRRAPSFHALRTGALAAGSTTTQAMPWTLRWALTGVAALSLMLAGILAFHHTPQPPPGSQAALAQELDAIDAALQKSIAAQESLTAWQSPTDFLLASTYQHNIP